MGKAFLHRIFEIFLRTVSELLFDFNLSAIDSQNNFHRTEFPHECRKRTKTTDRNKCKRALKTEAVP